MPMDGPGAFPSLNRQIRRGAGSPYIAWNAAKAAAAAATKTAVLTTWGDSTTLGFGSGSASDEFTGARYRGYPGQMQTSINSTYTQFPGDCFFGSGGLAPSVNTAQALLINPSLTSLGSFVVYNSIGAGTLGGGLFQCTSGTTPMTWTTTGSVDTISVYLATNTNLGTVSISIDGTVVDMVSELAASGFIKKTYSVAAGVHTVALARALGSVFVIGIEATNSLPKNAIFVRNIAEGGAMASDFLTTTNGWSPGNMAGTITQSDLSIYDFGINEWSTGVTPASFTASLTSLINLTKGSGSGLVLGPVRSDLSVASAATQQAMVNAAQAVAGSLGCDFLDIASFPNFSSCAVATAAGLMYDTKHPKYAGYTIIENAIRARIGL